jgi:hypothetical protein
MVSDYNSHIMNVTLNIDHKNIGHPRPGGPPAGGRMHILIEYPAREALLTEGHQGRYTRALVYFYPFFRLLIPVNIEGMVPVSVFIT